MTYRPDLELELRLSRLVDGLPAPAAPPVPPSPLPYRTPRWMLVAIAVALAAAALLSYVWLTHVEPLPSTTKLICDKPNPFECHDSAEVALNWLEEVLPSIRDQHVTAFESAEVWADDQVWTCRGHCPAAILHRIETLIQRVDIVKVLFQPSGRAWLTIVWCRDGQHWIDGTTLGPSLSARMRETPC